MAGMALLPAVPASVEDAGGTPRYGTYEGGLAQVDLSRLRGAYQPSPVDRALTHKKWVYGFLATHEVAVAMAVVDVGYSSNCFVMAVDLRSQTVLVDEGFLGPPRPLVTVNDAPNAGCFVNFQLPQAHVSISRPEASARYRLRARAGLPLPFPPPALSLNAELLTVGAGPPLTVIAPVEGGIVNVTQKTAGLVATGQFEARGRRWSLDGAVGGLDYSQGFLARRTSWRWAFACGRLESGLPIALNLVEGFNDARDDVNENALWLGNRLIPLPRARIEFESRDVLEKWHVRTVDGSVSLELKPIAAHRERRDLGLVKSRFSQPLGLWSGVVKVDGVEHRLVGVPGVAEDQDVTW